MEDEVKNKVWEALKGLWPAKKEKNIHPFIVWKDDETDMYRWIAVYSSKWRDDDNPPEILASAAHKEFVEAVDKGDWPYPEAWLWHVPGTRFGVADIVTYDDTGFALASGTVDKGQEHIAEFLMAKEDLAMSHGMPIKEIERDKEDSTIITRYRSIEISPLPREAAANKHGTAIELIREVKMAIPENKRPFFAEALGGEEGLKVFEAVLADKAKELEELEIESKGKSQEEESVEPEGAEEEVAEPKEAPAEETPKYVTEDEVAEAVGLSLQPVLARLESLTAIEEAIEEQGKSLKELEKSTEEQVKETIANTPAASLFEQIQSAIGSPETLIDGRTKLAKDGPKETFDESEGPAKVGIVNELMDQSWGPKQ